MKISFFVGRELSFEEVVKIKNAILESAGSYEEYIGVTNSIFQTIDIVIRFNEGNAPYDEIINKVAELEHYFKIPPIIIDVVKVAKTRGKDFTIYMDKKENYYHVDNRENSIDYRKVYKIEKPIAFLTLLQNTELNILKNF